MGPTKTLAKAANKYAKQHPEAKGVGVLDPSPEQWSEILSRIDVGDVWGVGYRWAKRLRAAGIETAEDLRRANPAWIAKGFNVVLERTVRELNGIPCIPLELQPQPKQQIVVSRSFGEMIDDLDNLRESITTHATRAGEKLRKEGLAVINLYVFAHTNPFIPDDPQYHGSATIRLPHPTQDTRVLVHQALTGLNRLYKTGYRYKKSGVMLLELIQPGQVQGDLFNRDPMPLDCERTTRLMDVLDRINRRMGRGTVFLASQGVKHKRRGWHLRRELQSPRYTTVWSDLCEV